MNDHCDPVDDPRDDSRDDPRDDLGLLIADAVADVEPDDRFDEIRRSTASARRARRTWYTGGGALLAAAAAVTAFVVIGPGGDQADPDPAEPTTLEDPSTGTTQVYYVGPGPDGPDAPEAALYRYAEPGDDALSLLMSTPSDPDYSTPWPEGSLVSYEVETDRIRVLVDGGPLDDQLARQQLIYTLQGVAAERLPVELEYADGRELAIAPVERAGMYEALSLMSIDAPAEGVSVTGSFTATGRSNGYEGTVACWLEAPGGDRLVETAGIAGWIEERLFPWKLRIDLTDVPPGGYTFTCSTDDPTGGTDGFGAATDTRAITVE